MVSRVILEGNTKAIHRIRKRQTPIREIKVERNDFLRPLSIPDPTSIKDRVE